VTYRYYTAIEGHCSQGQEGVAVNAFSLEFYGYGAAAARSSIFEMVLIGGLFKEIALLMSDAPVHSRFIAVNPRIRKCGKKEITH
jgi:hypothetical protein